MPKLGEIRKGKEIGYKVKSDNYIWHACIECGKPRWVRFIIKTKLPKNLMCKKCAERKWGERLSQRNSQIMEKSIHWKSGRVKQNGYILIKLSPNDFFYPMVNSIGYVLEHRLVVAKALGRCLHLWEIVHHKGTKYPKGSIENRGDNRYPENLQLVTDDRHKQITILERRITYLERKQFTVLERRIMRLEDKVREQSKLIKLLQWHIKERQESSYK